MKLRYNFLNSRSIAHKVDGENVHTFFSGISRDFFWTHPFTHNYHAEIERYRSWYNN